MLNSDFEKDPFDVCIEQPQKVFLLFLTLGEKDRCELSKHDIGWSLDAEAPIAAASLNRKEVEQRMKSLQKMSVHFDWNPDNFVIIEKELS